MGRFLLNLIINKYKIIKIKINLFLLYYHIKFKNLFILNILL